MASADVERQELHLIVFGDADYESKHCSFGPGDLVAVYTDGLTEMASPSGELYGEERLIEYLCKNRESDPEQIVASLLAEVETFSGDVPRSDDITLLVARRV